MNSPRVVSYDGLTLNLATLRAIRVDYDPEALVWHLVFEHKTRMGYIQHPDTMAYEKQEYQEETRVTYEFEAMLKVHYEEWVDLWQDYLDDQFGG